MNTKRLSLSVFFLLLTFSIGLVSVNLPISSYAQNNALSQIGNGKAIQDNIQSQLSNQDNQIVLGDSSILSGNNLNCQNQDNSKESINDKYLCNGGVEGIVGQNMLGINAHVCGTCTDAIITISDSTGSQSFRASSSAESAYRWFTIPVNDKYTVTVDIPLFPQRYTITFDPFSETEYCKEINDNSCSGIMGNSLQTLFIDIERR